MPLDYVATSDSPPVYLVKMPKAERRFAVLYQEIDGFYVCQWAHAPGGFIEAWVLRAIADKLDALNLDWSISIAKHFADQLARDELD